MVIFILFFLLDSMFVSLFGRRFGLRVIGHSSCSPLTLQFHPHGSPAPSHGRLLASSHGSTPRQLLFHGIYFLVLVVCLRYCACSKIFYVISPFCFISSLFLPSSPLTHQKERRDEVRALIVGQGGHVLYPEDYGRGNKKPLISYAVRQESSLLIRALFVLFTFLKLLFHLCEVVFLVWFLVFFTVFVHSLSHVQVFSFYPSQPHAPPVPPEATHVTARWLERSIAEQSFLDVHENILYAPLPFPYVMEAETEFSCFVLHLACPCCSFSVSFSCFFLYVLLISFCISNFYIVSSNRMKHYRECMRGVCLHLEGWPRDRPEETDVQMLGMLLAAKSAPHFDPEYDRHRAIL
jgi:hypothetical protein